jgi:aspartyl-tRNA(Asn)/glutamyl-tRNA(Gln) amidotransferase subunit A
VGAVLESLLEAKWGGPLLAQAPDLAAAASWPVENLVGSQEAK